MKSYKKLVLALLSCAVFTQVDARRNDSDEDTKTENKNVAQLPWPFAPVEDAAKGAAGIVTLNETGTAESTAYIVPDAVPGVSYQRKKDAEEKRSDSSTSRKTAKKHSRTRHSNGDMDNDDMN